MKVLVIEDERFIRENIVEILHFNGIEAHGAADGQTGLALIRDLRPCLVICDVMLNDIDGFEVLHALHADPDVADIPLVFVTGLADHQLMKRARQSGAREYLVKPFTQHELLSIVWRFVAPT